jgi:hypothetical protein
MTESATVRTKDRVGAGLAVVAAIVGLVLVFTHRDAAADDDAPAAPAPPSVGQVAPVPGQAPGQVRQPAAPAPPQRPADDDGDDG